MLKQRSLPFPGARPNRPAPGSPPTYATKSRPKQLGIGDAVGLESGRHGRTVQVVARQLAERRVEPGAQRLGLRVAQRIVQQADRPPARLLGGQLTQPPRPLTPDQHELLKILAPEHRDVGRDEVEQLRHHGEHALEMAGAKCAAKPVRECRREHDTASSPVGYISTSDGANSRCASSPARRTEPRSQRYLQSVPIPQAPRTGQPRSRVACAWRRSKVTNGNAPPPTI